MVVNKFSSNKTSIHFFFFISMYKRKFQVICNFLIDILTYSFSLFMTPDSSARVVGTPSEGEGECRRLYFLVYLRDSQAMNRRGCESIPVHSLDLRCERLTKCNQFNSIGPVSALRGEGVGEGEGEGEVRREEGGVTLACTLARERACARARLRGGSAR